MEVVGKQKDRSNITDEELKKLADIYKSLDSNNRYLTITTASLLLTSQQASEQKDQKAG